MNSSFFRAALPAVLLWIVLPSASGSAAGNAASSADVANSADLFLLVFYVALALCMSFLCSIAEAVLLSITPAFIESEKSKHPKRAKLLKRLKQDDIDRSLAAILTLNTVAHTAGAIGAGAKAAVVFGNTWFGLFSAVMTLMILYLSEIVPKTIGAVYWMKLAGPMSIFVRLSITLLFPLVWISEKLTKLIARDTQVHIFSREEFLAMTRIGEESGHINDRESRVIQNLFRLQELKTEDVMTPRTVMATLSENLHVAEAITFLQNTQFSRIPVYKESINDITGFVLRDDVLLKNARGEGQDTLASVKRVIHVVPNTMPVSLLFDTLLEQRQHIAIVVNEYGGTEGLVTLEDLVETLIGTEITDELDTIEDMRVLARRLWQERAAALGLDRTNHPAA